MFAWTCPMGQVQIVRAVQSTRSMFQSMMSRGKCTQLLTMTKVNDVHVGGREVGPEGSRSSTPLMINPLIGYHEGRNEPQPL